MTLFRNWHTQYLSAEPERSQPLEISIGAVSVSGLHSLDNSDYYRKPTKNHF